MLSCISKSARLSIGVADLTGQKMTTTQLQKIITETGYTPVQRDSLYRKIK